MQHLMLVQIRETIVWMMDEYSSIMRKATVAIKDLRMQEEMCLCVQIPVWRPLGLSSHPGGIVSFWICSVSIATLLPVALRGPVLDRVSVVLITGTGVDRIPDLSAGLTGL